MGRPEGGRPDGARGRKLENRPMRKNLKIRSLSPVQRSANHCNANTIFGPKSGQTQGSRLKRLQTQKHRGQTSPNRHENRAVHTKTKIGLAAFSPRMDQPLRQPNRLSSGVELPRDSWRPASPAVPGSPVQALGVPGVPGSLLPQGVPCKAWSP